jgi:hypothetical protein
MKPWGSIDRPALTTPREKENRSDLEFPIEPGCGPATAESILILRPCVTSNSTRGS